MSSKSLVGHNPLLCPIDAHLLDVFCCCFGAIVFRCVVYRATGSRSPYAKAATASRRRGSWKENWEKRLYIHLNTCFSLIAVSYQYTMQHLCGEWHWNKNYQHRSYCTNILYLTSPDSDSDITITGDGVDDVFCVCLRWIMECTR